MASLSVFRAASDLVQRVAFATRHGLTFGGARDTYKVLGYSRKLTLADFKERYDRGDVAGRVVDAYPSATWRGFGELIEDEDPTVLTTFEEAWITLAKRLRIWSVLKRADTLAGLGRYAVVLIGAPGEVITPLPRGLGPEAIAFLSPLPEADARIASWVIDIKDPRYGMPLTYQLARTNPGEQSRGQLVHWSRVIHVADGLLDNEVYGRPRLLRIWNRLDDLDKVVGGGSEAFWLRANTGIQFDIDKEMELDPDDEQKLKDEISEFEHQQRRVVRTRGVTMNAMETDVADFAPSVAAIISLISAATGIPQRILMGSERGQLASTQDRDNWAERVQDRRDEYAGPYVARALVDRLIESSALPTPADGEYEVRWPQIDDLSDSQKVDMATKLADVNNKAGELVFTPDEIRERTLGFPPLEDVLDPEELEARRGQPTPEGEPEGSEDDEEQPRAAAGSKLRLFEARQLARSKKKVRVRSNGQPIALVGGSAWRP